jgi:hypothetical protein
MDQTTLVDEQIADGKRFLDWLGEAGFPVIAAGWVRESERWRWYLDIVSPVVEEQGIRNAYHRLNTLVREMPQPCSIGPLDLMVFGPDEPLAEALLDLQHRHPGRSYFHLGGSNLRGVEIEAVYLYPPVEVAQPHS